MIPPSIPRCFLAIVVGACSAGGLVVQAESMRQPLDRSAAPSASTNAPATTANQSAADGRVETSRGESENAEPERSDGLWPSRKLLRLALTRLVDDASDRFEVDETRRVSVREEVVAQWEEYLTNNRTQLQPLLDNFLEMRLDLEPPGEEQVRKWADRARPLLDDMRVQVEKSWDCYREVIEPLQRAKFEAEVLAARAGLQYAESRLDRWREGSFELYEVWEPRDRSEREDAREKRRERRAQRRAQPEAELATSGPDEVDKELDRWDQYVVEVVARYQLDEGQRSAVLSLLAEMKRRARDHRDRYRNDIEELEHRINEAAEGNEEREAIKTELLRLYGPIDELFAELERRLGPIPTQRQQELAASREDRKPDQDQLRQSRETSHPDTDRASNKGREAKEQDPPQ